MLWKLAIEIGFLISLIANALLFVPQAIKLYQAKSVAGVSIMTFFGFNIIQLFTAAHAYFANDMLLFIGSLFAFVTCGIVTLLAFLYRRAL